MPYESPEQVAEKVNGAEKLSAKKRRQFMHVFNSCYDKHHDDGICHKMAWGVVKKASDIDWEEMNRRQSERRDPDGIDVMHEIRAAIQDIRAANRMMHDATS